mgnify:FL=1
MPNMTRKQQRLATRGDRVETLDDEAVFDAIVTNVTKTSHVKKVTKDHYEQWWRWLKQHPLKGIKISKKIDDLTWVGKYAKQVQKFIGDKYAGKVPGRETLYAPNTKKIHLTALAHVLLAIDKDKFKEFTRPLWNESLQIAVTNEEEKEENTMTESERKNWVCFSELETRRDAMIKEWKKDEKNTRTEKARKHHMYSLILAFNTYIPPLRLDLLEMEIWKEQKPPPAQGVNAYLWQKKKGSWTIVINHDKVTHHGEKINLPRAEFDIEKDIPGVTKGKAMNDLINASLKVWKRDYVLMQVRDKNTPMRQSGYDSALKWMFKGRSPKQNILRKSFVNHFYGKMISTKLKKQMAERMRHSVEVAMRDYFKVEAVEMCENVEFEEPEPEPEARPIEIAKAPAKEKRKKVEPTRRTYFNPRDYAKKYREKHKDKLEKQRKENYQDEDKKFKLLRAKHVWGANHGYVRTVRQSTIDKYELKQDKDGTWF